ncbi:MAG: ribonuclease HI [Spirochaetaceae bacterium]|nr:ribonuclease HI [Spirochaetaceae bacterium]
MNDFIVYTDGGCSNNPGPGAWAYVIHFGDRSHEDSGFEPETTNNRMELIAVIQALTFLRELKTGTYRRFPSDSRSPSDPGDAAPEPRWLSAPIKIHTDSQYVRNGITAWISSWKLRGWKTSDKKPVKNQELWIRLDALVQELGPEFFWVAGHAGNPDNERCDSNVRALIKAKTPQK